MLNLSRRALRLLCIGAGLATAAACSTDLPTEPPVPSTPTFDYFSDPNNPCQSYATQPCQRLSSSQMISLQRALNDHIDTYAVVGGRSCADLYFAASNAISQGRTWSFGVTEWRQGGAPFTLRSSYNSASRYYAFSRGYFGEPSPNGLNYRSYKLAQSAIHEAVHELNWGSHPQGVAYTFPWERDCILY